MITNKKRQIIITPSIRTIRGVKNILFLVFYFYFFFFIALIFGGGKWKKLKFEKKSVKKYFWGICSFCKFQVLPFPTFLII